MEAIEELIKELNDSEIKNDAKKITANRGRLIKKIRQEIKKIRQDGVTPEEEQKLKELEELLSETVIEHKDQINTRYKEEFIDRSGSFLSTITALPKGISLAIQKVKTCIEDLKDAKKNKERIFKAIDVLKSAGILLATPVIFTGKFLLKHWYLVVLFLAYVYNIPGLLFKAGERTLEKNAFVDLKNQGYELLNDLPFADFELEEKTTFLKELSSLLKETNLNEEARNRASNLVELLKKDYESIREGLKRLSGNLESAKDFVK